MRYLVHKYLMKIFVQSDDLQAKIQLDLLSNPPVMRWFDQCVKLQEIHSISGRLMFHNSNRTISNAVNNELEIYSNLLCIITRLEILLAEKGITKFIIPKCPKAFNRSQHWLNDIHNIFIDVTLWITSTKYMCIPNLWYTQISKTVKEMNTLIHHLERWAIPTANRQYVKNYGHKHLQTQLDLSYHGSALWFPISQEEQDLYHSSYEKNKFHQVVFSNSILGKTYYQSFIDEEKANSSAISGIDATWGNLDIKLDQEREAIFYSSQFQTWLNNTNPNTESAPLEFPVGSINVNSNLDYFIVRNKTNVVFSFLY